MLGFPQANLWNKLNKQLCTNNPTRDNHLKLKTHCGEKLNKCKQCELHILTEKLIFGTNRYKNKPETDKRSLAFDDKTRQNYDDITLFSET